MTRDDLQALARTRIREARILLRNGAPDGAYYLLGLAVESALKACIARRVKRHEFPDKSLVNQSYSHDLNQLLSVAGLKQTFDNLAATSREFAANWAVVKDWTVESRYAKHDPRKTTDLYNAIRAPHNGVMACIRQHW